MMLRGGSANLWSRAGSISWPQLQTFNSPEAEKQIQPSEVDRRTPQLRVSTLESYIA